MSDPQKREAAFLWRMEGLTFKQIGVKMGIHLEGARQLYNGAVRRRRYILAEIPEWQRHRIERDR